MNRLYSILNTELELLVAIYCLFYHETFISSMLLSFKFHIYFDSSVLFALLRWRSELRCLYNLSLNVRSVNPM